eukprot:scaffold29475_cov96-Isochrysis_galbana.AAC.1
MIKCAVKKRTVALIPADFEAQLESKSFAKASDRERVVSQPLPPILRPSICNPLYSKKASDRERVVSQPLPPVLRPSICNPLYSWKASERERVV